MLNSIKNIYINAYKYNKIGVYSNIPKHIRFI